MQSKLLFDLEATQPIDDQKRHGGGKYAEIVFFRMIERNIPFSCYYNSGKWINPLIIEAIEENNIPLYDIKESTVDDVVKENGLARLFSAIPGSVATLTSCKVFGTIHDLRFLELPYDRFYYKYKTFSNLNAVKERTRFFIKSCFPSFFKNKTKKAYLSNFIDTPMNIITVSNHSKYEILSYIPEARGKVLKVFYSPNTSSKTPAQAMTDKTPYFLSVSGKVWVKNVLRSIIAFDNLVSEGFLPDMKYKITGAKASDFYYNLKNPSSFDFLGYVDDTELESLYANAFAFVYPSLSEGFGYPPLEAMRYKVPVIASPISSMAQILDTGALYFNPFSIEEIMNRMLMITDDDYHEEFSQRGYNQFLKIKERQDRDLDSLIDYITQG